jgi:tripartite-type tricarboxylate transporter receptor subunit TctC
MAQIHLALENTMLTRRSMLKALAPLAAAALTGSRSFGAQTDAAFPSRTVRLVTPFPPGSGPDVALRLVADGLAKRWGQAVVVENKAGGNGFIAVAAFKQGSNDGHDLLQLDNNHCTTHPHTFSHLPYDMERDFTPLRMILRAPFFVAVGANSAYKSVDDIIAAARGRPGGIMYGSWFVGSPGHIGALKLEAMTGVHMTHVPYRDFGQLYAAVATGEVAWALGTAASAGPMERAGKIRFIALAAPRRDSLYPQVPATSESPTLRGFEVTGWTGLFAPKAISAQRRDQLSSDIAAALALPDVVEQYRALGYEAPALDAGAFTELIRRETRAWGETIQTAHLRLD